GDAETAPGASGSGRQPRRSPEEPPAPFRCWWARSPEAPAHVGRFAARSRDAPPGVRHFAERLAEPPRAGRWNAERSSRGRGLPLRHRLWLNALHHEREVEKMATIVYAMLANWMYIGRAVLASIRANVGAIAAELERR